MGVLTSPTGRCYNIPLDRKATDKGIEWTPHYTKVCNYPIQGLATADIVPMMMAHMWKWINEHNLPIRMCNQVHDSLLFEVPTEKAQDMAEMIKRELEKAPEIFERIFGHEFDLPLTVEVTTTDVSWAGPWSTTIV